MVLRRLLLADVFLEVAQAGSGGCRVYAGKAGTYDDKSHVIDLG